MPNVGAVASLDSSREGYRLFTATAVSVAMYQHPVVGKFFLSLYTLAIYSYFCLCVFWCGGWRPWCDERSSCVRRPRGQTLRVEHGVAVERPMDQRRPKPTMTGLEETMRSQRAADELERSVPHLSRDSTLDIPKYVRDTKQELTFFGYFREGVPDSPYEVDRIRHIQLKYYVENDTVAMFERPEENSGIPQGAFLKRHKVPKGSFEAGICAMGRGVAGAPAPKPARGRMGSRGSQRSSAGGADSGYLHWQDLRVGTHLTIYSRVFRITGCDPATRRFYEETRGAVPQPPNESEPVDSFSRRSTVGRGGKQGEFYGSKMSPIKRYVEARLGNTAACEGGNKMRRYLQYGDQKLMFYGFWDDRHEVMGELVKMRIYVYLANDEVEAYAVHEGQGGRPPVEKIYKKARLPRRIMTHDDRGRGIEDDSGEEEYYHVDDFRVGNVINLMGRRVQLADADEPTMRWVEQNWGIDMRPDRIEIPEEPEPEVEVEPPPYMGFGSEEDSLGSFFNLTPKIPRRDDAKAAQYQGILLQFYAKMIGDDMSSVDREREFIVLFYMENDNVAVYEPPIPNSGIVGGKFLSRRRLRNPATGDFFRANDFYVGAKLNINGFIFHLADAPEHTLRIMDGDPRVWATTDINFVLKNLKRKFEDFSITARRAFRAMDKDFSGYITVDELDMQLRKWGMRLTNQELMTLMRHLDKGGDGKISFEDFCAIFTEEDYGAGAGLGASTGDLAMRADVTEEEVREYEKHINKVHLDDEEQWRLTRLLEMLAMEFASRGGEEKMREQFRKVDADKSNTVDREEFHQALVESFHLPPDDVALLEKRFFPPDRDELRYEEFMRVFRGQLKRSSH